MAASVKASGGTTEVMLLPDAGRLFNFRQPQDATKAWQATVAWFDKYLRSTSQPGG